MKHRLILTLGLTVAIQANADVVSNQAQLTQLIELVRQGNDQLREVRRAVSLQEQLRDMKQLELVQEVAGFGAESQTLMEELDATRQILGSYTSPDEQIAQLREDVEWYLANYERAANQDDALAALAGYSRALSQLDNQYWTGQPSPNEAAISRFVRLVSDVERLEIVRSSQRNNQQRIAAGIDTHDAARISATDTNLLLQLAIAREERHQAAEARELEAEEAQRAVLRTMMGFDYE